MKRGNLVNQIYRSIFERREFKLDFAVIGTQKAGTSAIDKYLREHSAIEMPRWKELHYFDNDGAYERKEKRKLRDFFFTNTSSKIYGECTPIYMYWTPSLDRLRDHNPKIKIIALLRNPVERAFSHWNMEITRHCEDRSFKECIEEEMAEIKKGLKEQHRVKSYVHRGLYAEQIEKIYSLFPKEQVLFIKYEDFRKEQVINLNRIFSFLGVASLEEIFEKRANEHKYKSNMTVKEKTQLLEFFEPTIQKTEELLSWDCSDWR